MRTPTTPRSPSKTLTPDEHVDAWNLSGLSARVYAERHGLNPASLYSWRRRLRARTRARVARRAPAPRILPVVVEPSLGCEVTLPDGRRLRFSESLPAARLRAFLDAMERP